MKRLKDDKASILIAVLIASALIAIFIASISESAKSSVLAIQRSRHSSLAKLRSRNSLLKQLSSIDTRGKRFSCSKINGLAGHITITRQLCSQQSNFDERTMESNQVITSRNTSLLDYPLINYNLLLRKPLQCRSEFALNLGKGIKSARSCVNPKLESRGIVVNGNLLFTKAIETNANDNQLGFALIAARGELAIGALTTSTRLIILAGGDLQIQAVTSRGCYKCSLTLVSATGFVKLQHVSSEIAVRVFAWNGASIPGGLKLPSETIHLPIMHKQALSLERLKPG